MSANTLASKSPKANGVYLASAIVSHLFELVPYRPRAGETSTANPGIRRIEDVASFLLDVGNLIQLGDTPDDDADWTEWKAWLLAKFYPADAEGAQS